MRIIKRNNSSLHKSIETKAIRKHIHKGNMNAGKFFGVIKVEHLSTADVLQAKLFPVLVLCTWKIYIQDQPHSSKRCLTWLLEHKDQQNLAIQISTKLQLFIPEWTVLLKVSWSKIYSMISLGVVSVNIICCKKEDYKEVCMALLMLNGNDNINQDWTWPQMKFVPLPVI